MDWAALLLFWVAAAMFGYAYAGFPLLVFLFGTFRRARPVRAAAITPRASLVIAAHNEAENIGARLENALAADYPLGALEIMVASDGSTDGTESIVEGFAGRGVRLLRLPRAGKIAALEVAARAASGEVLIFSDANTFFERGTLHALVRSFADPAVGGVVGHTAYFVRAQSQSSGLGERLYWRYDTWIKRLESRAGSVVSAHGGLYAVRRELFRVPADRAVTDDFIISTEVVAQGQRLVFEPDAIAWEEAAPRAGQEFGRRVRLMTRGLRAVYLRRALLNPWRYGRYALFLFSHKVVRRLVPLSLVALLVSSLALSGRSGFFAAAGLAQASLYTLAAAGFLLRGTALGRARVFYVPFFYCMANAAALVAWFRFLRGDRISLWQPQRSAAGAS
ncbi:MAG TPA: glycosyltransferase family 2 protein [Longimicrobiales bacterium]|nr:glycosyltransferase family 2 protein [Longimicrobiales bacterium]